MKKIFKKILIIIMFLFLLNLISTQSYAASDVTEITEIIKNAVAKWYYVMRLCVILFMLVFLIFVGIKMAISTVASDKALYKTMLVDWLVGMILVFSIHYIMIGIIGFNEMVVSSLEKLATEKLNLAEEYEYGKDDDSLKKTASEIEMTLYETARTKAYSLKLTDGFMGMITYGALVYYAWKFSIIYLKRLVNIVILTLLAPIVSGSYAFNKIISGKSKVFSTWLTEYVMNVFIQIFHAIMYVSFVTIAYTLAMKSLSYIVLAFVIMSFMTKADALLRQIFNFSGNMAGKMAESSLQELKSAPAAMKQVLVGGKINQMAMKGTYRVVTKPIRKTAEIGFGKYMVHKAEKFDSGEMKSRKQRKSERKLEEYKAFSNWDERNEKIEQIKNEKIGIESKINNLKGNVHEKDEKIENRKQQIKAEEERLKTARKKSKNSKSINDSKLKKMKEKLVQEEEERKKLYEKNNIEIQGLKEQMKIKQQEIDKLEEEEKMFQTMFEERESNNGSLTERIGDGIDNLFDYRKYTYKDSDGKWHAKKNKRDGYLYKKKTKGIGKTFFENASWQKILNVDSKEEALIKATIANSVNQVKSLAYGIAGFGMIGANGLAGMTLLSNAVIKQLETSSFTIKNRNMKRIIKHQKYIAKQQKKYKFAGFNSTAQQNIAIESLDLLNEAEKRLMENKLANSGRFRRFATKMLNGKVKVNGKKYYKKVWKLKNSARIYNEEELEALSRLQTTSNYGLINRFSEVEKQMNEGLYEKRIREEIKDSKKMIVNANVRYFKSEFNKIFDDYSGKVIGEVEALPVEELMLRDIAAKQNGIVVNGNIIEIKNDEDDESDISRLFSEIEDIDKDNNNDEGENKDKDKNITHNEKIQKIKGKLIENKKVLIKTAIIRHCVSKGVIDIKKTPLSSDNIIEIQNDILLNLEKTGFIQKGEISLEDLSIKRETITNVFNEMYENDIKTNEELEKAVVENACLEYISNEEVTDLNKLKDENAKKQIYKIIVDKVTSDDTKKSMDVIKKIKGQESESDSEEDSDIPDSIKDALEKTVDNVKKIKKPKISKDKENKEREILVQREVNRQISSTMNDMEQALYLNAEDDIDFENMDSEIVDEDKLKMLFVLSELKKQNAEGKTAGIDQASFTRKDREKLKYFQNMDVSSQIQGFGQGQNPEGIRQVPDFNLQDGSRRVKSAEQNLNEKIYGPVINLPELVNSTKNRRLYNSKKRNVGDRK